MARKLIPFGLLLMLLVPTLAYEVLQKASEHLGARGHIARMAELAEAKTPWSPRTGRSMVDHPLHEMQETRLFWSMAFGRAPVRLAQVD